MKKTIALAITTTFLGLSQAATADLTTGLVAHWTFDNCMAADVTGNGHDGVMKGSPQCVEGVNGKAFAFNGTTDYFEVADDAALNPAALTMVAWIKPRTLKGVDKIILNKENQYEMQIMPNQNVHDAKALHLAFAFNPYWWWYDANVKPSTTTYTQVAITFDKNYHGKSYINGKLTNDISYETGLQTTTSCLLIGARGCGVGNPSANSFFDGIIDDVRLYKRTLSGAEIKALYQEVFPPVVKGSVAWAKPYDLICQNNTTGKSVVLDDNKATQFDCEKAGLVVNSGDEVSVTVTGKRF